MNLKNKILISISIFIIICVVLVIWWKYYYHSYIEPFDEQSCISAGGKPNYGPSACGDKEDGFQICTADIGYIGCIKN